MDAGTVIIISGIVTLLIERVFTNVNRIRNSECMGGKLNCANPQEEETKKQSMENMPVDTYDKKNKLENREIN